MSAHIRFVEVWIWRRLDVLGQLGDLRSVVWAGSGDPRTVSLTRNHIPSRLPAIE